VTGKDRKISRAKDAKKRFEAARLARWQEKAGRLFHAKPAKRAMNISLLCELGALGARRILSFRLC
jgi:hypothetical protein